jgi:hypothetical protein
MEAVLDLSDKSVLQAYGVMTQPASNADRCGVYSLGQVAVEGQQPGPRNMQPG